MDELKGCGTAEPDDWPVPGAENPIAHHVHYYRHFAHHARATAFADQMKDTAQSSEAETDDSRIDAGLSAARAEYGRASASVAAAAARRGLSVVLLEREDALFAHSTGRSAASVDPSIGAAAVQALTRASMPHFTSEDEPENRLLTRRPVLLIGGPGDQAELQRVAGTVAESQPRARLLSGGEAQQLCSVLRSPATEAALLLPDAFDIDTESLYALFLARAHSAGLEVQRGFAVEVIHHDAGAWLLGRDDNVDAVRMHMLVNAAGAWADEVAQAASVPARGLRPLRRTVLAVGGPDGCDDWPLVADVRESFYFKPWGRSQLLLSPADEVPDEPGDARPAELDVARCIEAVNVATTLSIRHVRSTWAGHRTFAPDDVPVVGFDADAQGFFWCAGLGGTGIQNAPAVGEFAGALLTGEQPGPELAPLVHQLSPRRFTPSA